MSKLHNLREIGVNTNMITYVNFTEILSLPYLEYLDVSQVCLVCVCFRWYSHVSIQNDITLPFPSALIAAKRTTLKYLDMSNNHFYGQIPSFYNFTALNDLILQNNKISGELTPDWFDECAKLQYLDISINKLSGPAPDLLGATHILFVDISSNKFSGPVPPRSVFGVCFCVDRVCFAAGANSLPYFSSLLATTSFSLRFWLCTAPAACSSSTCRTTNSRSSRTIPCRSTLDLALFFIVRCV